MKIASIAHATPSRLVTNDEIVQIVRDRNADRLDVAQLDACETRIRKFLSSAGAEIRRYRQPAEKASAFLLSAARSALLQSGASADEIDFIIYVGVGRGWIEPAMAGFVQSQLNLSKATGFDILDACASWLRGVQIAHSFLKSGVYRTGLIVNCEFNAREFLNFEVTSEKQLQELMAGFTIGEAATAAVVTNESANDDFYFRFTTDGQYLPLCMIPSENAAEFLGAEQIDRYRPSKFFAHSGRLMKVGMEKIMQLFPADENLHAFQHDIIFTHAVSSKPYQLAIERLGLSIDAYFDIFPQYGNTVSASVPLAMSLAIEQGRLHRGARVLIVAPSAGFTMGFAAFTF